MKKILSILLAAALLLSMVSCSSSSTNSTDNNTASTPAENTQDTPAEQIVIKISHQNASTHPVQIGLEYFKQLLEEKSGGTMTCDIYDSAVLGNDTSNLQQVIGNSLDAAMIMGVAIWSGYDGRANIEELPFAFSNYEQARTAWDGDLGDYITENVIKPQGGVVVGYWENGFRHFTNNVRPINEPADMKGIKFRTAQSEIRIKMFEELGSSAVVMAFSELYTGLQQGTVDGQENPLSNIVSAAFYEVQDYLSLSGHIYNTSVFIFSDKFWNSLTKEQQDIIIECSDLAKQRCRELNESQEEDYLETIRESGTKINEVDHDAFVKAVAPVWDMFEKEYGNELIDLVKKYSK